MGAVVAAEAGADAEAAVPVFAGKCAEQAFVTAAPGVVRHHAAFGVVFAFHFQNQRAASAWIGGVGMAQNQPFAAAGFNALQQGAAAAASATGICSIRRMRVFGWFFR